MELVKTLITTQEQRVDWERHSAVREAVAMIGAGWPDVAYSQLLASVHKQARWMPSDLFTERGTITFPRPVAALRVVS